MPKRLDEIEEYKAIGGTALWDGVQSAIEGVQAYQKEMLGSNKKTGHDFVGPVYEVVIITDGKDSCSSASFEDVCTLAAKPGIPDFNLVIVAVGSVNQTAFKKLCEPRHCHFFHATDMEEFQKTLARAVEQIKMRMTITAPTSQTKMQFTGQAHEAMSTLKNWTEQLQMLRKAQEQGLLEQLATKLTITEDGTGRLPTGPGSSRKAKADDSLSRHSTPQRSNDCWDGAACQRLNCRFLHPSDRARQLQAQLDSLRECQAVIKGKGGGRGGGKGGGKGRGKSSQGRGS